MNKPLNFAAATTLQVPQGEFELERHPRDDRLQAWDAADEFLLGYLDELPPLPRQAKVLLLNDAFGAIALALAGHSLYSWNDSYLAQLALRQNLRANGFDAAQIKINRGVEFPSAAVDLVLIKIPKMRSLLEHQLYALRRVLHHDSRIIAAGMTRHIHNSTLELFDTLLGPTNTTRARKKSRLILTERDHSLNQGQSPYPGYYELEVDRVYQMANHASLFSRDRLDRGTRMLIEQMPQDGFEQILDLGCGNGVLGIVAAALNRNAELTFVDESYMAIASAELNFHHAFAATRKVEYRVEDGLSGMADASCNLVLLNPPFHQQHQVGIGIAWQLIRDARRVLAAGGELRMVGNRHLGYHAKLKNLFGNCTLLAADSKFVVLRSLKS